MYAYVRAMYGGKCTDEYPPSGCTSKNASQKCIPKWIPKWIPQVRAHRNKMTSFVENPATADPSTLMTRCGQVRLMSA